ncbi:MAG: methylmalonyl Co-A mutase-associated GTPase MeaB [Bacteroidetes bacterium]|nr:methylmalonyl Co-A mutase-associated GTPase MeaB [Bacteroidota bacterium]
MRKEFNINEMTDGILSSNISYVSKAITLVESTKHEHQEQAQQIINSIIKHSGNSFRLGITGVPGVGKSTFIESFGLEVINRGHKLAVLAIDPSSQLSKGSILGDKTRMEQLSVHPKVFIRPSPSSGSLGGVARKTKESIIICEAAGYDYIFIETVGVGQSETAVHQLTDFFLLLMLAGAGDELQGIKRGIMEMADGMVITKADGTNTDKAKMARGEYARALHLFPPTESNWIPEVLTCSSTENKGIKEVYDMIDKYKRHTITNHFFETKRANQTKQWLHQTINDTLIERFYANPIIKEEILKIEKQLEQNQINPYQAAMDLFNKIN